MCTFHRGTGMREKSDSTLLMTEGNIAKQIIYFSVPLILGNLLQQLYNTADSIIVGNIVGSNALAAVGSSTALIHLLIAFSMGASVGTGVIVSQYLGAEEHEKVHSAVHTALAIAVILGLILTVAGIVLAAPILHWMNTPEDVFADSTSYMQIYFGGILFGVVYNMASGILNAVGNSKRSLLYLGCASIINIILDLVFVGLLHMGVAGAALATDISQLVSSVLALAYLMRVKAEYRVELKQIKVDKRMAGRIIKVGLPTGIQNMVISFSNVLVQSGINRFGATAMAGYGAYAKVDGFNILPVSSFSMALTTFTGQNYGAGKIDRVKRGISVTLIMGIVYTIITGVLLMVFGDQIMRLFADDVSVIAYGKLAMRYFCPFYSLLSVMHGLAGAIRGTGKTVQPMAIFLISLCVFRVLWLQFVLPFFTTIDGIFMVYPISWALGMVLMIIYAWKGKWLDSSRPAL